MARGPGADSPSEPGARRLAPPPSWIFFDLGCTLFDEDAAQRARIAEVVPLLAQRGVRTTAEALWRESELASEAFAKYPFQTALVRVGVPDSLAAELRGSVRYDHAHEQLYPGVASLLATLARSFRLGVIANQSRGCEQRMRERGIGDHFSVIAASAELGMSKPDPAIFRWALERAGCQAERALMVGDRLDNDVAPARRLGMSTVRVLQGVARGQRPRTAEETPHHALAVIADLAGLFA